MRKRKINRLASLSGEKWTQKQKLMGIKKADFIEPAACFLNNYFQYTAEIDPRPNLIYFI